MPAYHDQDASEQRQIKYLLLTDEEMSQNVLDVRCEIDDGTDFRADLEIDTVNGDIIYVEVKPGKSEDLLCFLPAYPWKTICGVEKHRERDDMGQLDMCWEADVLVLFWSDYGQISRLEFFALDNHIKNHLWNLPRQKGKDISSARKYHNRERLRSEYQFCGCGNENCYYLSDYVRVNRRDMPEPFLIWDSEYGSHRTRNTHN